MTSRPASPLLLTAAFLVLAGPAAAQTEDPVRMLEPPSGEAREPRAVVRFAPDRFDDILWENDRTAQRIYGPALQHQEPPSSSGIDVWAKRVRWPFMDRQLQTGNYHIDRGEGQDHYNVGGARGAGGLGIWQDDKLWVSRNFTDHEIIQNGPDVARFRVDYAPWPVGVDRAVWESRTFTLPLGTNFTRMVSTLESDSDEPLIVGIGIARRVIDGDRGVIRRDAERGVLAFWEPDHPDHGAMGVAVMVDPDMIVDFQDDADNYLVLLRVTPGEPFVYYTGSAWDRGLDFSSREEWDAYVDAQTPDFDPTTVPE